MDASQCGRPARLNNPNRYILEQMNHEEKRQTVSFQFNNIVHVFFSHGKLGSAGKYYQDNKYKKYYRNVIDHIFHYTRWITLKRWTSWRDLSPRHCTQATQHFAKKYGNGGELLATLCLVWPARDLNFGSPAPETNPLPLDQQTDQSHSVFSIFYLDSSSIYLATYSKLFIKIWGSAIKLELITASYFYCSILLQEL